MTQGNRLAADAAADAASGNAAVAAPGMAGAVAQRSAPEPTDAHRAELARRVAEHGAIDDALAAFGAAVSHDLREPLRSLDGFGQALIEDYGETLPAEGRLYLDRIMAATGRLRGRIDALLRLTEMIRRPFERERVDLGALADEMIEGLRTSEPDRAVRWQRAGDLVVSGDRRLLRVLIGELIDNAWRFTAPRSAARIRFERRGEGFALRDDGVGFHPRYAERIFAAFARYHTDAEFPGAGMGLALVRCAVERHGGRIAVRSAVEAGAEVVFTLAPGDALPPASFAEKHR